MVRFVLSVVLLAAAHSVVAQAPPAHYDVFVVAGQSNAQGYGDSLLSPRIPPGVAYVYTTEAGLEPLVGDPVGNAQTGSAWPAFATEYHARTGRGVVMVEAARGGSSLIPGLGLSGNKDWSPTGILFGRAVRNGRNAMALAATAGLDVRYVGWLWSQGEQEAALGIDGGLITEADYRAAYRDFQERFVAALPGARLIVSQTGMPAAGDIPGYAAVRRVQSEEVASQPDVVVGGRVAEMGYDSTWTFPSRRMMIDHVHYSQAGYNEMGRGLARYAAAHVPPVSAEAGPTATSPLRVFPNPASSHLTVEGALGEVDVVDVLGRIMLRSADATLDVSRLARGLYVVRSGAQAVVLTVRR